MEWTVVRGESTLAAELAAALIFLVKRVGASEFMGLPIFSGCLSIVIGFPIVRKMNSDFGSTSFLAVKGLVV